MGGLGVAGTKGIKISTCDYCGGAIPAGFGSSALFIYYLPGCLSIGAICCKRGWFPIWLIERGNQRCSEDLFADLALV
jgi:hypothetical protein